MLAPMGHLGPHLRLAPRLVDNGPGRIEQLDEGVAVHAPALSRHLPAADELQTKGRAGRGAAIRLRQVEEVQRLLNVVAYKVSGLNGLGPEHLRGILDGQACSYSGREGASSGSIHDDRRDQLGDEDPDKLAQVDTTDTIYRACTTLVARLQALPRDLEGRQVNAYPVPAHRLRGPVDIQGEEVQDPELNVRDLHLVNVKAQRNAPPWTPRPGPDGLLDIPHLGVLQLGVALLAAVALRLAARSPPPLGLPKAGDPPCRGRGDGWQGYHRRPAPA
mmetsp:Transcript_39026/g.112093  ORF Transcript_39026/g.112093 Transcript_39026/m.112093 type:complete len:275 (+) Transcript_39026:454-1278(+)